MKTLTTILIFLAFSAPSYAANVSIISHPSRSTTSTSAHFDLLITGNHDLNAVKCSDSDNPTWHLCPYDRVGDTFHYYGNYSDRSYGFHQFSVQVCDMGSCSYDNYYWEIARTLPTNTDWRFV